MYIYIFLALSLAMPVSSFAATHTANDRRRELADRWLIDAQLVAKSSKDDEAIKIAKFLVKESVLQEPGEVSEYDLVPNNLVPSNGSKLWIGLLPLVKEDFLKPKPWIKSLIDPSVAGFFYDKSRSIVLVSKQDMGPISRGLIFLREGRHALGFIQETREEQCPEEFHTTLFELRILREIGGRPYSTALNDEMERMHKHKKAAGVSIGSKFAPLSDHYKDSRIDIVFQGRSRTEEESDFRKSLVYVAANFLLIDKYYAGQDKDAAKQKALCSLKPLIK